MKGRPVHKLFALLTYYSQDYCHHQICVVTIVTVNVFMD